jgi:hypothetical protein
MNVIEHIPKKEKQIIIATFLFGLFTGFFLFVTVFAPTYNEGILPAPPKNQSNDITVTGVQYGPCLNSGMTCPSFELNADGVLRSIGATPLSETEEVEVTELPRALIGDIRQKLQTLDWPSVTEPRFASDCGTTEINEYRYVVTMGEVTYIVDTCATEFPFEGELNQTFLTFFVE